MVEKYQSDLNNANNLDEEASRLGMGGNLSQEEDEKNIKRECKKERKFNLKE